MKILVTILIVLTIFGVIFLITTLRRIKIVFKKMDYLTEDLTYKFEFLSSSVETIKNFSRYFNLIDSVLNSDDPKNQKYINENRKQILLISEQLRKIASKDIQTNLAIEDIKSKESSKKSEFKTQDQILLSLENLVNSNDLNNQKYILKNKNKILKLSEQLNQIANKKI